jgi:hypothetical protein
MLKAQQLMKACFSANMEKGRTTVKQLFIIVDGFMKE